jgi:hypothetical protein
MSLLLPRNSKSGAYDKNVKLRVIVIDDEIQCREK